VSKGTPSTLEGAIENGLNLSTQVSTALIRAHVVDLLSQKFTAALMMAASDPQTERALQDLWTQITKTEADA
jgi:hypothetical protein